MPYNQLEKAYFQILDAVSFPLETQMVETSYGDTQVIVAGRKNAPPLVLLPGFLECSPLILSWAATLLQHFQVFIVDIPGLPNLSTKNEINDINEQGANWLLEVFSKFRLSQITLIGSSFGGQLALQTIIHDASKIKEAYLLNPSGLVRKSTLNLLEMAASCFWKSKNMRKKHLVKRLIPSNEEPLVEWVSALDCSHFNNMFQTNKVNLIALKKVAIPVHMILGKQNRLFSSNRLINTTKSHLVSLESIQFCQNTGFVPGQSAYDHIFKSIVTKLN